MSEELVKKTASITSFPAVPQGGKSAVFPGVYDAITVEITNEQGNVLIKVVGQEPRCAGFLISLIHPHMFFSSTLFDINFFLDF